MAFRLFEDISTDECGIVSIGAHETNIKSLIMGLSLQIRATISCSYMILRVLPDTSIERKSLPFQVLIYKLFMGYVSLILPLDVVCMIPEER